ncbi:MAG: hypothetical protein ACMG6E_04115 [Candidatus Roizmanbacteria bacterium]
MVSYDKKQTIALGQEPLDAEGNLFVMWTPKDCDALTFHVCPECKVMAVTCNKCEQKDCQLIGHDGIASDGSAMERQEGASHGKDTTKPISIKEPRFNIDDLKKELFKFDTWQVHGHFWYCGGCGETRRITAPPKPVEDPEAEEDDAENQFSSVESDDHSE